MRKWRTVIFVNGCFWHGHDCENNKRRPTTNAQFWQDKIERNRKRDERNLVLLQNAGWNVIVVWECQLSTRRRADTLRELDLALSHIVLHQSGKPTEYTQIEQDTELPLAAEPSTEYGKSHVRRRKSQ